MVKHYRPTLNDATACGEYDPIDDESTDDLHKITCGECHRRLFFTSKTQFWRSLPTPRQLRDTANGPWEEE